MDDFSREPIGSWRFLLFEGKRLQQVSAANENEERTNVHTHIPNTRYTHTENAGLNTDLAHPPHPHIRLYITLDGHKTPAPVKYRLLQASATTL